MPTEKRFIEVTAYRDKDGKPTCATNFETGEVCQFYRTQRFGCNGTCVFAESSSGRYLNTLHRRKRPDDAEYEWNGTLIPLDECPVWKGEER